MKAARVTAPFQLTYVDLPAPEIAPDQVLLKINCFGVCGSDMQIYHGKHKYAAMPVVMGHELCATVEKTGADVKDFKVGDKVTVEPQIFCGECYPCRRGRFNVCESLKVLGVHLDGCNCEYLALEPRYLHPVPQDMPEELAALVEPLAVGVGAAKRSSRIAGGNVAVVGAGTIGNLTAQAAKRLGAGQVLSVDINQTKLDYALACGIDFAVNTADTGLKEAIEASFGSRKADIIIDCAAVPAVFEQILAAARPDSDIIMTGNYKEAVRFEVPLMQRREINLIGHMMYVREDFQDAIRLLYEKKINTERIISQVFPFDRYREALAFADQHPAEVMKMIVKL